MDEHCAWEGPQRRHHLPLPPGAAEAAARLPPVHEGGGRPPRGPHLQGQVRGEQAGVERSATHAEGAGAHRYPQGHVHAGLEAGDREGVQPGFWDVPGGGQDRVPEGDLPLADLRVRLLRGEADHRNQVSRTSTHRHQQTGSLPHTSTVKGKDVSIFPMMKNYFYRMIHSFPPPDVRPCLKILAPSDR